MRADRVLAKAAALPNRSAQTLRAAGGAFSGEFRLRGTGALAAGRRGPGRRAPVVSGARQRIVGVWAQRAGNGAAPGVHGARGAGAANSVCRRSAGAGDRCAGAGGRSFPSALSVFPLCRPAWRGRTAIGSGSGGSARLRSGAELRRRRVCMAGHTAVSGARRGGRGCRDRGWCRGPFALGRVVGAGRLGRHCHRLAAEMLVAGRGGWREKWSVVVGIVRSRWPAGQEVRTEVRIPPAGEAGAEGEAVAGRSDGPGRVVDGTASGVAGRHGRPRRAGQRPSGEAPRRLPAAGYPVAGASARLARWPVALSCRVMRRSQAPGLAPIDGRSVGPRGLWPARRTKGRRRVRRGRLASLRAGRAGSPATIRDSRGAVGGWCDRTATTRPRRRHVRADPVCRARSLLRRLRTLVRGGTVSSDGPRTPRRPALAPPGRRTQPCRVRAQPAPRPRRRNLPKSGRGRAGARKRRTTHPTARNRLNLMSRSDVQAAPVARRIWVQTAVSSISVHSRRRPLGPISAWVRPRTWT